MPPRPFVLECRNTTRRLVGGGGACRGGRREVVRFAHLEQPQDVKEPVWKSRHRTIWTSRRHPESLIAARTV